MFVVLRNLTPNVDMAILYATHVKLQTLQFYAKMKE